MTGPQKEEIYQDPVEENTTSLKKPFLILGLTTFLVLG